MNTIPLQPRQAALAALVLFLASALPGRGGELTQQVLRNGRELGRAVLTQLGVPDPETDGGRLAAMDSAQRAYRRAVQASGVDSPAAKAARADLVTAITAVQLRAREHFQWLATVQNQVPWEASDHRASGQSLKARADEALAYQRYWDAEDLAATDPAGAQVLLDQIRCRSTGTPVRRDDDLGRLEAFDVRKTNPYDRECDRVAAVVAAARDARPPAAPALAASGATMLGQ